MPILLAERLIELEHIDLANRRVRVPADLSPRSPGLHQSGILHAIAHNVGWLKPGEWDDTDKGIGGRRRYPNRWLIGVMFEEMWFSLNPVVVWQPGGREKDGIWVTCDGIDTTGTDPACPGETVIDETKATEKKVRTGAEMLQENLYMHQGRGYAHVYPLCRLQWDGVLYYPKWAEDGSRVARWTVLFLRGDYKGSGPVIMQYVVRFSAREIAQTWEMLVMSKGMAEEE